MQDRMTLSYFSLLAILCTCVFPRFACCEDVSLWTTGSALMPGWGLYPNPNEYGGSKVLGGATAWGTGNLTWVADFPAEGVYQVWVRRYGGYGNVVVSVDEQQVTGGKGGPGGGRYVWVHAGEKQIRRGKHHVDAGIQGCMLDVILFTTKADLNPEKDTLPDPVKQPALRASRAYRDDSIIKPLAGKRGFVVGSVLPYEEQLNDFVPSQERVIDRLKLWGSANQYISGSFAVRALEEAKELAVSLTELAGPNRTKFSAENIDLRVVNLRKRTLVLYDASRPAILCPDLLLRNDRTSMPPKGKQGGYGGGACTTSIPAHESRQFWTTVHVPGGSPAGTYRGSIQILVRGAPARNLSLPVEIEVLPIDLRPVEGYYSIYHPNQPTDPKGASYVSEQRYLAELKDQVRHGLNAATLYGGFPSLKYAKEAGMTEACCVMSWPDSDAHQQVEAAKAMGFTDLYYYGVDEPHGDRIEVCRKEAERRMAGGLHMFTAVNSIAAQEATKDFIDRPVYNLYVFGGKDNPAAMYVRSKGFKPISYWTTMVSFPLWYRGLTGLYNTACGYLGVAPWAYQDFPDNRLYNGEDSPHAIAYPDESGDPIPTLRWEAMREGIDDVRYMQALDRAIAAAQERLNRPNPPAGLADALAKAREVRKTRFESISGRWFEYLNRLQPEALDTTRREMAEATVSLNQLLR